MIYVFVNRLFQTNGLHSNRNCVLSELINLATSIVVFFIAHSFHTHQCIQKYVDMIGATKTIIIFTDIFM